MFSRLSIPFSPAFTLLLSFARKNQQNWRMIMENSAKDTHALVVTDQPNMLNVLKEANVLLDEIQKGSLSVMTPL